jgi:hypothetical protein
VHPQGAVLELLAGGQLVDVSDAAAAQPPAGTPRHHHPGCAWQPAQRRQVQVIGVQVRQQHEVGVG